MVKKNTKKKEEWDGPDRKVMIEVAKIMNLVLEPGIKVVACKTKDLWKDIQDNAEDIYLSDDDEDGTLTEFYKENNLEFGIEDDNETNEKPVEEVAEEKTEELEEEVLPEPEKEVEKPAAKKAVKKKSPKKETKETNMTAPAFNKTFIDYIRMLENNEINPNPAFQRKSGIWKKGDNINFIKTLLSGLPIPEFYIGEIDDEVCLFDGLQRTTALWDWYTGELQGTIKQYKNLSKAELKTVNSFPFVFRDCGKIKEEVAEEIFTRLNATSYSLNKIEILNAAFSGEFISTAQELVKNKLFSSINLFPENQVKRMLDVEYILILMSTFEDSYFAGSSPIKKFVKDLDSEYENKDKFIDKFEKVCKLIISCKLEKGSIWTKKAALFSLISELMVAKKLPKKDALITKLDKFEIDMKTDVENERIDSNHYEFNLNIIQSSGSKGAREQRAAAIKEYIL